MTSSRVASGALCVVLVLGCGVDNEDSYSTDWSQGKADNGQAANAPCSYTADAKIALWGIGRSNQRMRDRYKAAFERLNAQYKRFKVDNKTITCGPRLQVLEVTSRWWGYPNKEYTIQTRIDLPDPTCFKLLKGYWFVVEDVPDLLSIGSFFSQIAWTVDQIPEYGFGGSTKDYDYVISAPSSCD